MYKRNTVALYKCLIWCRHWAATLPSGVPWEVSGVIVFSDRRTCSLISRVNPWACAWDLPHLHLVGNPTLSNSASHISGWLIPLSPCHCIWRHPHRHTHECACVNYSSHLCDEVALRGKDWFGLQLKWIQSQCTSRKSTRSRAELSKL